MLTNLASRQDSPLYSPSHPSLTLYTAPTPWRPARYQTHTALVAQPERPAHELHSNLLDALATYRNERLQLLFFVPHLLVHIRVPFECLCLCCRR